MNAKHNEAARHTLRGCGQQGPLAHKLAMDSDLRRKGETAFYKAMGKAYIAIGPEFGKLLYSLVRSTKAQTVVEFGTSFGVSTIYLAAAVRDNGSGKVITTEFDPEKAAQAKKNLAAAGLEEFVEFRVGDAHESLSGFSPEIDLLFLDGTKGLYFAVLKLLEPRLRSSPTGSGTEGTRFQSGIDVD